MKTVTASEFQKNFGAFKEIAQREPVTVTSNGRESVVLISATEYQKYAELRETEVSSKTEKMMDTFIEKHHTVLEQLA